MLQPSQRTCGHVGTRLSVGLTRLKSLTSTRSAFARGDLAEVAFEAGLEHTDAEELAVAFFTSIAGISTTLNLSDLGEEFADAGEPPPGAGK